jgi:hypothetical protein
VKQSHLNMGLLRRQDKALASSQFPDVKLAVTARKVFLFWWKNVIIEIDIELF